MLAILQKEINSFLNSMVAYIVIGVFLVAIGLFMWVFPDTSVLEYGYADMQTLFNMAPWLFLFLIPAITMRSFSEERRAGTLELLLTKPLTDSQLILGKYLACLLLADLSMSTDAHLDDEHKVIDVITDSLLLFGEALSAVGDDFALYGFSSLRRHQVRMQELKSFKQRYGDDTRGRIQALKPGYYTRMGAAIRQATELLGNCKQRRKLLLLVTDGKPNDLDLYEGRYGVEDTRQAVLEARRQGLLPFCITIDQEAGDYLPYMFGANGYTLIKDPQQLPFRLPQLYKQLTQP